MKRNIQKLVVKVSGIQSVAMGDTPVSKGTINKIVDHVNGRTVQLFKDGNTIYVKPEYVQDYIQRGWKTTDMLYSKYQ